MANEQFEAVHDSIKNYITNVGTSKDPIEHGRPSYGERLTPNELDAAFVQNDLARRIITELPTDSIRTGLPPMVYADTGEKVELPFRQERELIDKIKMGAINGRLYGGAFILCITEETENLAEPIDWDNPPKAVNTIGLDRYEAVPTEWGKDAFREDFQKPRFYSIHPQGRSAKHKRYPRVHRSRLLPFHGNKLPKRIRKRNQDYHDSVLQVVWSCISRYVQSEKSVANIINRFEIATMSISGLRDAMSTEEGVDMVETRMDMLHRSLSILKLAMIDADAGEQYSRQFAQVNGLELLLDRLAQSVAKAARYPMTQLFGEDSAGIRGDDEAGAKAWRKQVEEYQINDLLDPTLRLVSVVTGRRVEPVRSADGTVRWGLAESPRPIDQARIDEKRKDWVTGLLTDGVITLREARQLMAQDEIDWSDYSEIEADDYSGEAEPEPGVDPAEGPGTESGAPEPGGGVSV